MTAAEIAEGAPEYLVTQAGEEIVQRLVAERRASLARRCEGWSPEHNPELNELLTGLARELAREPGREVATPAVAQAASGPSPA